MTNADDEPQARTFLVPHCEAQIDTVYRDAWIWVIAKPSGLLSVPGRDPRNADSVLSRLQRHDAETRIVHRLDLPTSGLMVLARDRISHAALSRQFQQREVDKRYQAIVQGHLPAHGQIELPMITDWPNRPRQKICFEHGKAADTRWQRIEQHANHARLWLIPHTGRSHQLRVHMAAIGHPIHGCEFYAGEHIKAMAERLLLHAAELRFRHPQSGATMHFENPTPF